MKMKELNSGNAYYPKPETFRFLQFTKGLPLSFVGVIVYTVLLIIGKEPKDFHGICKYFEIGRGWGGFECGWFFVCAEDSNEQLKAHEVGHGVFNANIGGFRTLFLSAGSMLRYWYRHLFGITTPYDAWWYEYDATTCGNEYVRRAKTKDFDRDR